MIREVKAGNRYEPDMLVMTLIRALLLSSTLLSVALPVLSADDPRGLSNQPEPGWGMWRPSSEIEQAGFSAGFSNIELGGALDFRYACAQALGLPDGEEPPFWFRLSNLVNQIGTGQVEFGCWKAGQFVSSYGSTAVSTQVETVDCLQVSVPQGLRIRSQPTLNSKIIGYLPQGAIVEPDSFPASITEAEGRNWVAIRSPIQGWVSNDRPETPGNLTFCRP